MAETKLARKVRDKKAKKTEHISDEPVKIAKKAEKPKKTEKSKIKIDIDFSKKENAKKLFEEQNLLVFKEEKKTEKWFPVYDYWIEENKVHIFLGQRMRSL